MKEKALVGAFSVITNLRMELFQALFLRRGLTVARTSLWEASIPSPHTRLRLDTCPVSRCSHDRCISDFYTAIW